ncbi:flagellar protein FlaG [Thiomicrospira aerophila AL3]|uniref:Flagellar protein FlaG n=2 Tax=Thiomicrospira aerophila TaxID=92245 RepID=W0DT09_9GAMM|nr:flagellar protein FlaG [Thiomicrospira aerophila AL3]
MDSLMPPSNVEQKIPSSVNKESLGSSINQVTSDAKIVEQSVNLTDAQLSLKVDLEDSIDMVAAMNSQLASLNVGVAFAIDDTTNASIVKVIDRSTSEVIRQYPNDEALKVMQNIKSFLESVNNSQLNDSQGLTGTLLNEMI